MIFMPTALVAFMTFEPLLAPQYKSWLALAASISKKDCDSALFWYNEGVSRRYFERYQGRQESAHPRILLKQESPLDDLTKMQSDKNHLYCIEF